MAIFNLIHGGSTVMTVLTSAMILSTYSRGEDAFPDQNRTCTPAEAEPTLNSSSCYPLVNFTRPFCQNHGYMLDSYIFRTPRYQTWKNKEGNKDYDGLVKAVREPKLIRIIFKVTSIPRECKRAFFLSFCHQMFPRCDRTRSVFQEQKICRETCQKLYGACGNLYKLVKKWYLVRFPEEKMRYNCELQPYRNAGDSPECWYYNELADGSTSPDLFTNPGGEHADCLHLNGSSYHGNISVTSSGITCQSWTEQCPHRHTMNTTYPELNLAKNYCRNPQNSGQQPWCFTTDRSKRWEYCDIPKCITVDGNYSNWSLSVACNVTCGRGFEKWRRKCENPEPKFDGRNCSHLGEAVQYRPCTATERCPVSGGYSKWTLSTPCNVLCGEGVEKWRRRCDNPEPKYGGRNCSEHGDLAEFRNCSRKPCPIDGNYGNWTKSSPCSVTCGQGVEIWIRECDNPPGKYGGNCSGQGNAHEVRLCEMPPCPGTIDLKMTGIIVGAVVFVLLATATAFCFIRQKRCRRKQGSSHCPIPQHFDRSEQDENACSSQDTSNNATYQNLTTNGNPLPGYARGVVHYRRDYMNARPSRILWYDKLQLVRPKAMEWLRNAWGNVDESGRHVYDVTQDDRHDSLPYDKLPLDESARSGTETDSEIYNHLERMPISLQPTRWENLPSADTA